MRRSPFFLPGTGTRSRSQCSHPATLKPTGSAARPERAPTRPLPPVRKAAPGGADRGPSSADAGLGAVSEALTSVLPELSTCWVFIFMQGLLSSDELRDFVFDPRVIYKRVVERQVFGDFPDIFVTDV